MCSFKGLQVIARLMDCGSFGCGLKGFGVEKTIYNTAEWRKVQHGLEGSKNSGGGNQTKNREEGIFFGD